MNEDVTLFHPKVAASGPQGLSSAFPRTLVDEVRRRVAVLAGVMFAAFSIDWLLLAAAWAWSRATGVSPALAASVDVRSLGWVSGAMLLVSIGVWRIARHPRVRARDVHLVGLAFGVGVCYVVAGSSLWQHFVARGYVPAVTWVPALVLLFPLLLPGPPARMLTAVVAAGAATPVMLIVLQLAGRVEADAEAYVSTLVGSVVAVALAHIGSRTIYGLGREAAASRELGSYRLEEKLGEGGMGEVWRARHRLLARPAAVKLIRGTRTGARTSAVPADAVQRFEREARAIASLRSPHTVQLFDFGVSADGAFYYAMEMLDGLTIDALVHRHGPVPAERTIHVLRQMCHSLSEAESRGLIHRDIKPANVFLARYGEDHDFVKVLDFGIVKCLHDDPERATFTRAGQVPGTPAFLSPEQVLGRNLDARVDIYATGCVAYWMLTGQLVFPARNAVALALDQVHTLPAPPSARTELAIPSDLDDLVLACLAKDPADRPASARELSQQLGAINVRQPWTEARAQAWWATHEPVRAA